MIDLRFKCGANLYLWYMFLVFMTSFHSYKKNPNGFKVHANKSIMGQTLPCIN